MIKANELRIGNLVESNSEVFAITVVHPITGVHEKYNPIPLTEEWLLKFGFTKSNKTSFNINDNTDRYTHFYLREMEFYGHLEFGFKNNDVNIYLDIVGDRNTESERINSYSILYIHQLQNLYFALTEKELLLK